MKYVLSGLIGGLAFGLVLTTSVNAQILGFDDVLTQGGTISYAGGVNPVVGTDIIFDQITGHSTPSNDGVDLICEGCLLNFSTGSYTGKIPQGPGKELLGFLGGGTLSIMGVAKDGATTIADGVLVSGSFTSASVLLNSIPGESAITFSGLGLDEKHPDLEDFYGVMGLDWVFANTDISLNNFSIAADSSFSGIVDNADFNNERNPNPPAIPEPSTMLLMGTGLIGLGIWKRKKAL